jgi:mobilization protein NikA
MPKPKAKKAGRPPLPKGQAKVGTLRIRVTPDELRAIESAAKAKKQSTSEWIREAIMGRNVERWYAFCAGDLHIPLFESRPNVNDLCYGCGGHRKLRGISKGYVSKEEADRGLASSEPLSSPDSKLPISRL